jgi:hypothetical protein
LRPRPFFVLMILSTGFGYRSAGRGLAPDRFSHTMGGRSGPAAGRLPAFTTAQSTN